MEQLGSSVAEQGNLVVTIDWDARQDTDAILLDLACSYNYGQSLARGHGGSPDVLVLIAPCLFEYQGQSFTAQPSGGNTDLQITIVSAEGDTVCEP